LKTEYHNVESCNKCAGKNTVHTVAFEICLHEAETVCNDCGFQDYWAYGFFASGSVMVSNCRKYAVN